MAEILLKAASISKSFAGVEALNNVSFDLRAGEVHALVGENGAGKSTLIKIITGAEQADAGTLEISNRIVTHHNPGVARLLGIAAIYQQPSLFPHLSVAENIACMLESGTVWRRINWRARRRRAKELISRTGAAIDPERLVSSLSMPEQQIVEIAKAIGANAKILILDEPTATLSDRETDHLFEVIALLRAEGVGIIYISHRLAEISVIADRVTVLKDGKNVAVRNVADVERAELIRLMAGHEIERVFPKRPVPLGNNVLEVRRLSNRALGIREVSLFVRSGEILGLAGLVGSGRTQLAETIFGVSPADSGEILLEGKSVRITSPAKAIQAGIGYVPEDRRRNGVALSMSIAANASLASLKTVSRCGLMNRRRESDLAQNYVKSLRIQAPSIYAEAGSLSGGNQQKVSLARWLAIGPKVLILDEPTQGVDVGSKSEIYGLMVELAERGLAIIMISSELPEILGISDRIAVMHAGEISGILARQDATQESILALALERIHSNETVTASIDV